MQAQALGGEAARLAQAPDLPVPIEGGASPLPDPTMTTAPATTEIAIDALPPPESVNYLTKLTLPWDGVLFVATVVLTIVATNFFFRWELRNDASPAAAYTRQSWLAYGFIGLAGFVFLLPHTGENAAGVFDLVTKFSWTWLIIGTAVLAVFAALSSLHRSPQDSKF